MKNDKINGLEWLCMTPIKRSVVALSFVFALNCSSYDSDTYGVDGVITNVTNNCYEVTSTDILASLPWFWSIPRGAVQKYCCKPGYKLNTSGFNLVGAKFKLEFGQKIRAKNFKGDGSITYSGGSWNFIYGTCI